MDEQLSKKERKELKRQEKLAAHTAVERRHYLERLAIWGTVILLIGGIFIAVWRLGGGSVSSTYNGNVAAVVADDHVTGNPSATVTLFEYSDFQCPACRASFPFVKDLLKNLGGQFRLVYRHFPLAQHQNAQLAAQAAEAASLQGKFWEMHDLLFNNQDDWAESTTAADIFARYAGTLNLDVNKFKSDINSQAVIDRVNRDLAAANSIGVNSTPTFYLGQYQLNLPSFSALRQSVEDAINKK